MRGQCGGPAVGVIGGAVWQDCHPDGQRCSSHRQDDVAVNCRPVHQLDTAKGPFTLLKAVAKDAHVRSPFINTVIDFTIVASVFHGQSHELDEEEARSPPGHITPEPTKRKVLDGNSIRDSSHASSTRNTYHAAAGVERLAESGGQPSAPASRKNQRV